MASKEIILLPIFREFMRHSDNGRRVRSDGKRISGETVSNYTNLLNYLERYEQATGTPIRLRPAAKLNSRQLLVEKNYWKRFFKALTEDMYKCGCFDNYVGTMAKILRTFFNYLEKEKQLNTGKFQQGFLVTKEDVPIVTLMPDQLQKMIHDDGFTAALKPWLRRTKDIFVVGCTVALRFGDLIAIRWKDLEHVGTGCYLVAKSQKTGTVTRVKLPAYVMEVLARQPSAKRKAKEVFPTVSLDRFNHNLRKLCELAGYTHEVGKNRKRRGKDIAVLHPVTKKPYRFCDLASSHIMRRTAITTMLMHGVPEHVVKKISGHSANSPAFHRYVNLVQSYLDAEVDKHHDKMGENSGQKGKDQAL